MGKHSQLADRMYQESQRVNQPQMATVLEIPSQPPTDLDTTDDFSRDRDMIRRIEYVFDHILSVIPASAQKDMRYKVLKQMMKDSLRDIALIPDRVISPLMRECGQALMFIADGNMEELEEYLDQQNEERENAGDQ
jgi:hypothetical protein